MSPRAAGRGLGVAVDDPAGGGRLDADDRDVVADDVVQLAGDAQPLVGDGAAAQAVALLADRLGLLGSSWARWRAARHASWPPTTAPPK